MARKPKKPEENAAAAAVEPAGKMFYQIRDVADMEGIKPHVLRYWETEFSQLRPEKGSTGQRIYREKDLKLIRRIKLLLYDKKFTIAGAKRQLATEIRPDKIQMKLNLGLRENQLLNTILKVKKDLESLIQTLSRP
jgi:DNA-binding transcriptional MerR regulator